MAWVYVPALPDLNWESQSLSLPTELSVRWRSKRLPLRSWLRVRKTALWLDSLFGTISQPSTADAGVESWILSLRACRASPTASPASGEDTPMNALSGLTSSESSPSVSPPWSSSRTSLTFAGILSQSEIDYASWVTELRQVFSLRQKSERRIAESDSSRWPTANAHDGKSGPDDFSQQHGNLKREAENWPTPEASDWKNKSSSRDFALSNGKVTEASHQSGLVGQSADFSRQVLRTTMPGHGSLPSGPTSRPRLNPKFVEWLQGFPENWVDPESTLSALSVMRWSRSQRHLLLRLLQEG